MGVVSTAVTRLEPNRAELRFGLRMGGVRGTIRGIVPPKRGAMAKIESQNGFSLIELLIVVAVALIIAGFAVPQITEAMRNFRISGDARNIKSEILLAKMRAAARFTRSRVRADFDARTFQTDIWNKGTNTWDPVAIGGPQVLSQTVNFGVASMTAAPVDENGDPVQTTFGQAPPCTNGAAGAPGGGGDMSGNTACVHFNSRGFPVDATGAPEPDGAFYIASGEVVHGVTVSVNGIARIWRGDASDSTYWIRR